MKKRKALSSQGFFYLSLYVWIIKQFLQMGNPFSFLLTVIRLVLLIGSMIVFISFYIIITGFLFFNTDERAFVLRRSYVRWAALIMGLQIESNGEALNRPALYVSNHRSFSDPFVACIFLDAYIIAKAEVADMPILNEGAKLTGIIYVKRDSSKSRQATRAALVETIKNGSNILIYPEGTTSGNPKVKEYRVGSFKEAIHHGFPVIPICCEYKEEKAHWIESGLTTQFFRQLGIWKTHVKIEFGPEIIAKDGESLRNQIVEWTNETIRKMHTGWGSYLESKLEAPETTTS